MTHLKQIFYKDIPEDIEEDWDHGTIIGWPDEDDYKIARAYKNAGDVLLENAMDHHEVGDLDTVGFPILFNYRHALELYLKVIAQNWGTGHDLKPLLFEEFVQQYNSVCKQQLHSSIKKRFEEFMKVDPKAFAFRYQKNRTGTKYTIKEEWWVEFEPLRQFMDTICSKFEQLLEAKNKLKAKG